MNRETEFRINLVFVLISFVIVIFFYFENDREFNEYKEITSKQIFILKTNLENIKKERDSLINRTFRCEVESGRHEVTRYEILEIKYPKVNKEYQYFYEHQTE
jgi:hypothetical protein